MQGLSRDAMAAGPMNADGTRVAVFGLGYVGLPVATVLAGRGFDVVGVDVSETAVEMVNQGRVHIVEPDLDMLVNAAVSAGKLRATGSAEPADIFVIAVPTPFTAGNEPDLSYIQAAVRALAPMLEKGNLVILESTVPVGATEQVSAWIRAERPDLTVPEPTRESADVAVAHCPERVLPGNVLNELVNNDRIIGGITRNCALEATRFYRSFVKAEIHVTDARTAELVKLVENASRDVSIAFANELSVICEDLGVNVWEMIDLANRHPRVNILNPGPGVGGHCIAVDPWFIISAVGDRARMMRCAREVNAAKPRHVVDKVKRAAGRFLDPQIACLGLAYKANIDDLRESPALEIVRQLAAEQVGTLHVVEPNLRALPSSLEAAPNAVLSDLRDALAAADVVVLLVDHRQFSVLDADMLQEKVTIDTCGMLRRK